MPIKFPTHIAPTPAIYSANGDGAPVTVVGVTHKSYRITVKKVTRLAGQMKFLHPGQEAVVPKRDVRLNPS